jgi:hypothetical protein
VADAVSRGSEIFANLATGTPWESVAKDVSQTLSGEVIAPGVRQQIIEDIEALVDEVVSWMEACISKQPKRLE